MSGCTSCPSMLMAAGVRVLLGRQGCPLGVLCCDAVCRCAADPACTAWGYCGDPAGCQNGRQSKFAGSVCCLWLG